MKKKKESERIARAMQARQMDELRKRNISNYFLDLAAPHRQWLKKLTRRYMERGEYEPSAWTLLPAYYIEKADKEIAVLAAFLARGGNHMLNDVKQIREMLGEHPHEWFMTKGYVALSIGERQNGTTARMQNWEAAQYFDRLWNEGESSHHDLQAAVKFFMKEQETDLEDAVDWLVGGISGNKRMLSLVLSARDGIGQGLWDIDPSEIKCPLTEAVKTFLRMWIPDFVGMHDIDHAISLFGLDHDSHFLYACQAYNAFRRDHPKECAVYETRYNAWYTKGIPTTRKKWEMYLPKTDN